MKKVVILGCENSHANTFLKFIATGDYPEIEIVGVYSDDLDAAQKLKDEFGVPVMDKFDEAVDEVDGVIVTARHGDNHYKYAKPYIKKGVSMFIDKPIVISEIEAIDFMRELEKEQVNVTGGSCCKYIDFIQQLKKERLENEGGKTLGGFVRAPISLQNLYGDFFFYSQHLVEMVLEVYGNHPNSVKVFQNEDKVTVVFRYDDYDVTALFVDNNHFYYAARYFEKGVNAQPVEVIGSSPCFKMEFEAFYKLLQGEAQQQSYNDFVAPVFVMNAINRSLSSGKEEKVTEYDI